MTLKQFNTYFEVDFTPQQAENLIGYAIIAIVTITLFAII